jgi:Family of unknown function (DUF5681)
MARWEPGQSGNPRGRPPGGESFAEALREALTPEKRKLLAEKAVALAIEGNIRAMNGSDTLLIFLLKGARPHVYRERYDVGVAVGVNVTVLLREGEDVP